MLRVDTFHHYDHHAHGDHGCRRRVRIQDTRGCVIMVSCERYGALDTAIIDQVEGWKR